MSTSLRLNGTTGIRFPRPTIGRIGATDQLHPHVQAAVEALVARVRAGLPAPPARAAERINELEAEARADARKAKEAQAKSDRSARALDEAYEEHAKLEDIAKRRLSEYTEAASASPNSAMAVSTSPVPIESHARASGAR
jgi:regulator of protease activity HflC (stomatin/prohibitin superfamily)